ncbi:hypothetical protein HanXRQr2_Chr16g0744351 [Helianthus annuus]|uniref:Uncharacterized protein n=1 Tax=Helianthus annuus TaxID=4232 RepID=A0A9K3DQW4_HELAN|nr:hypothetical protein HanXRQr2_Chr16g0744351 [Helianthus annuus]KAJ0820911.1 hypothetical protein HanPSC8_Chr16g0713701 [Helianthus annuus]
MPVDCKLSEGVVVFHRGDEKGIMGLTIGGVPLLFGVLDLG